MTTYFPDNIGHWKGGHYEGATWCDTYPDGIKRPAPWHDTFMSLTVKYGLTLYIRDTIREERRRCLVKRGRPLLHYASAELEYAEWSAFSDPNLVHILLLNGSDPNVEYEGSSAWQNCLSTPARIYNPDKWVPLLKVLLLHGADANECVETKTNGQQTALAAIQQSFDGFLTGNAQATQDIMRRFRLYESTTATEAVSVETLARLKLDLIELKELLIKAGAKDVHGKVRIKSSKMYGEQATLLVKRMFRRGGK
jgi:hypothetical protein